MQRHLVTMLAALGWVLALGSPEPAAADPMPPKPLGLRIEEAELIVVARVVDVQRFDVGDDWNSATARLEVLETLKGEEHEKVTVPFPANLLCPEPPRYAVGETVVALLAWDEKVPGWSTVGLSQGTLYPKVEELDDLKARVRAAVESDPLVLEEPADVPVGGQTPE
jgi:hypothetical protein